MSRRRTLLLLLVGLVASPSAGAHPQHDKLPSSRFVVVEVEAGRLRLAYSLIFADQAAARLRRRGDLSGDGQLSPAEARTLATRLASEVASSLRMVIDGKPHEPELRARTSVKQPEPVGPGALAIDLEWTHTLAPGRRHLRFVDDFVPGEPAPVELQVRAGTGARLLEVRGPGKDPRGSFHYGGRAEAQAAGRYRRASRRVSRAAIGRDVTGQVELEVELAAPPRRWLWPSVAGLAAVLLLGTGIAAVRYRRMKG